MNFYVCVGVSVLCCENHKCYNNLDTFFDFLLTFDCHIILCAVQDDKTISKYKKGEEKRGKRLSENFRNFLNGC